VYNLCSERQYDLGTSFPIVERFPFGDHHPPPLEMIGFFCRSVAEYLAQHPDNIVAVHCKAGKGRTGLMVAAYLLHSGVVQTAAEALEFFGTERTNDNKGVTIPSQQRYVHYYGRVLADYTQTLRAPAKTYHIKHIRFVTVPIGGCDPWFEVFAWFRGESDGNDCPTWSEKKIYSYKNFVKVKHCAADDFFVDLNLKEHNLKVYGDVRLQFYSGEEGKEAKKVRCVAPSLSLCVLSLA
jgi:phosphatidylinositol-3,4,5-trisphosphate 3-phosphatase/dual-specificity protein phosphatase PTEN